MEAGGGAREPVSVGLRRHRYSVLAVLLLVFVLQHVDRNIVVILQELIRREFLLSDLELGLLTGMAYALPFALAGVPLGALADRVPRVRLLAALVLLWSTFTALAGLARNFLPLLVSRAAVGAAEAGAPPTMLSLVCDTFPPKSRAGALSILFVGPFLAVTLGSLIGGTAAAAFGWRGALWVVAAPGAGLALLLLLTVREPQRGHFEPNPRTGKAESLRNVLRFSLAHPGIRAVALGVILASTVLVGFASWVPPLLMRAHQVPVGKAGLALALAIGIPGTLGALTTAAIAARYAQDRPERLLRLCVLGLAISIPAGVIGALTLSTPLSLGALAVWSFTSTMFIGPGHSLYLGWAPPQVRGTLAAMVIVACNLLGAGIGPPLVGALSDFLRAQGDQRALLHALACIAVLAAIPSLLFLAASRGRLGTGSSRDR
jgi:predicted MFS family arabinose efflux permease